MAALIGKNYYDNNGDPHQIIVPFSLGTLAGKYTQIYSYTMRKYDTYGERKPTDAQGVWTRSGFYGSYKYAEGRTFKFTILYSFEFGQHGASKVNGMNAGGYYSIDGGPEIFAMSNSGTITIGPILRTVYVRTFSYANNDGGDQASSGATWAFTVQPDGSLR